MRLLINLSMLAACVYLLFGEEPFRNIEPNYQRLQKMFFSDTIRDESKQKIDALMDALDKEVARTGAPAIDSVQNTSVHQNDLASSAVEVARETSVVSRTERLVQNASLDDSEPLNKKGAVADESGRDFDPKLVMDAPNDVALMSLSDRAYAIDRLIFELEKNAYR